MSSYMKLVHSDYTVRCGSVIYGTHDDFRTAKIQQIALLMDLDVEAEIEHNTMHLRVGMPSIEEQLDEAILHHRLGV